MQVNSLPVSTDDRSLLERLRRCQLWQLADKVGIQYPAGAPKTTMVTLLQGAGVDPTKHIRYEPVHGRDENGHQVTQYYPVIETHASARNNVDAESVLQQRIAVELEEAKKEESGKIDQLEKQNAELQAKLDLLLDKLAGTDEPAADETRVTLTLRQKRDMLTNKGIDPQGMTREEIDAALES